MADFPKDKYELLGYCDALHEQREKARAADDKATVERLDKEIDLVQTAISRIAFAGLGEVAQGLGDGLISPGP